ncbi:unnamed protein product, partial [Ilex paraguariensis]
SHQGREGDATEKGRVKKCRGPPSQRQLTHPHQSKSPLRDEALQLPSLLRPTDLSLEWALWGITRRCRAALNSNSSFDFHRLG